MTCTNPIPVTIRENIIFLAPCNRCTECAINKKIAYGKRKQNVQKTRKSETQKPKEATQIKINYKQP